MVSFQGKGILLDIEGTTSSVSYVFDVMFPFARRELRGYLDACWGESDLSSVCDQIAQDAGHASLADWSKRESDAAKLRRLVYDRVVQLMDADSKSTGLKQLQGMIWRRGFEEGELRAHLYEDVPGALTRWRAAGIELRVYSSGSVAAQKLFFSHTIYGDLLGHFRDYYDTTTGPKKEVGSYEVIATDFGYPPVEILFLSDIVAELDAARTAGFQTALSVRPGNSEVASGHGHPVIHSFDEITV